MPDSADDVEKITKGHVSPLKNDAKKPEVLF